MPAIKPGSTVLVTGANGYLATWIVQRLLERGYTVRGTVRSESKGVYLTEYFKSYGKRLELVTVPDLTAEGAMNKSLDGVSAVLHVASPLPNAKLEDPAEYIKPAVEGTLSVLRSALNYPNIKRVIYTSTIGAVMRKVAEPTLLSEKDWNDESIKEVEELGKDASVIEKYMASKTIAEHAAWNLYEKYKSTSPYDLVTILPPWPPIHELGSDPASLGGSLGLWYNICVAVSDRADVRSEETLTTSYGWADVRDLADAHVTALEKEDASGERILVVEGNILDAVQQVQSSVSLSHSLPTGKPGIPPKLRDMYDTSKAARLLGVKYRHIQETAKDTLEVLSKKGW
ncbi:D-lactaldehyde dehydrogenase [Cyathus striatus]|nr:D-lactaldehyde dehydrogenase [Cyathus striatus]